MEEEFNLSKHERHSEMGEVYYPKCNVKEFIKRLKEGLGNDCSDCNNWNLKFIDKKAGDKLI